MLRSITNKMKIKKVKKAKKSYMRTEFFQAYSIIYTSALSR